MHLGLKPTAPIMQNQCWQQFLVMSKWIKVQDKLPDNMFPPVLVSTINKVSKIRQHPTTACYCGGWGFERSDIHENSIVTHWQPLPDDPEPIIVTDFKEYFRKYTKKESSLYRCLLSGECFSWDFSKEHFEYLKKNNILNEVG